MGSSAVPTLTLNGRNWKVYQASLLKAAATKGWLGILSGQETNDESLRWEGKDAQLKMLFYWTVPIPLVLKIRNLRTSHKMFNYLKPVEASSDNKMRESHTKPEELSVEPPSEERLKDVLTEASSEEEAEAAVGTAQQTLSQSVEVKENLPELHEQPSSRAGKPLKSEHLEVLNGMVKIPDEVENVDKMAHKDLPLKLCNRSTTNDLPSGTLEWPMASFQKAKTDKGEHRGMKGHYMDTKNVKSAA
ncbi:hypothetical protein F5141DRAFT_1065639 [Pisolithus sp. B1]|nr:hypothetical protein F5141DRAFT_1065639 [Pisolithus sp. B1]